MTNEKNLLREWQETCCRKSEVFDSICRLSGSWAIAVLCSELEQLAIEEHDLLMQLEKFGVRGQEDALRRFCRLAK